MRKTVFLSSTGKDLSEFRKQLLDEARGYDLFHFDAMEDFGARDANAIEFCRRRVLEAGVFVGLIGLYRGWEPQGDNKQRSITEMEYDWATEAKKPRLMFVAPEDFIPPIPASPNSEGERQRRFRERILSTRIVDQKCFNSPHSLASAVLKALTNHMLYDLASQMPDKPEAGAPEASAIAAASEAIAQVARDEHIDVAEMQARGVGLDEIEAVLRKRADHFESEAALKAEAAATALASSAQYWKRLGALAFLYDTGKALAAYAKAAELDPNDWEALWYLGRLHQRAGDLGGARQCFESLIERQDSVDNPYYIHWSYLLLGDVATGLGNRVKALDHYEQGQALVKALAARDPNNATWQRDLSVSYNKIGDISAARGDRDGALKAYKDGLDIRKLLAARDPNNAEWQRDLSVSYDRVGDISAARGDRDGALKAYKDGLDIAKLLAARDPNNATWQRDLSVSYNKIGDISAARGDRDGALKAYKDGLDIRKLLAARDPNNATWQRDLSVSYDRVGDISAARGDRDGALKAYKDGLDIRKLLAARDPNNAEWQRDLSVSYNKIGDISAARGDRDGALKAYKDGLDIAKLLAARDPANVQWQTDLVVSAWKLAEAGAVDSEKYLRDALAILRRLDVEDRLTADQKGWIPMFENAIKAASSK